ncbi:MAG: TIGR00282 family metallophosphoesterase [Clostridiaceae bacterium]|nr:TIGR00282 family metallophosphoesterase [Clostridiaceae bacterium]
MKVLFIGDIVGGPGRKAVRQYIGELRSQYRFDCCIANAENAAGGSGITYATAQELYGYGIDAVTMGNHTWSKKEINTFIDADPRIARPANYPAELPGKGTVVIDGKLGVISLLGRIYMEPVDCPFRTLDRELEVLKRQVRAVIVDFHAEATSEKCALAWYADGRVSAVIGTHTHVQTADERILPCGTAFISDAGMTGPRDGVIGVKKELVIEKFRTSMPVRFEVAKGPVQFNGVILDIDEETGKATGIHRISNVFSV